MDLQVVLGAAAINVAILVAWWAVSSERPKAVDLRDAARDASTDMRTMLLRESATDRTLGPAIERLGARIGRLAPAERVAALQLKLAKAGASSSWSVDRLLAVKAMLAIGIGALLALRTIAEPSLGRMVLALGAAVFGWYVPNGLLDRRAAARSLEVRVALADTIDQLAVMVRAGLGIDGALARTAQAAEGALGQELNRVVQDMRVGVGRSHALANMSERVDVPELRSFVTALAQAESLGVPVAETLQLQSEELRIKRRQLAEEQAMKLPVKILFPMVVCILPTLFIVLLGPALMRILDEFHS